MSCTHLVETGRLRTVLKTRGLCRAAAVAVLVTLLPSSLLAQGDEQQDPARANPREIVVHAFGSVNWAATERPETPNSFALGQFSLFVTSAIHERVSVLAEIVMEASSANTQVTTDLERLQLTYRHNDHFNISAGRYHTGIGFYNAAFHHGSYFETPIGRPLVFAFEDEGGILPVHEVGLSVRGKMPRTGSAVYYLAEVGNGRRWTELDDEFRDQNTAKSTNIGLSVRPERWHGAEVGASFYRDDIVSSSGESIAHRIAAAYAVYRTPSIELMTEWLRLSHRPVGGSRVYVNHAGYVQASRAFGDVRPYYRYDRVNIEADTPLIGSVGSSQAHVLGLRFDPAEWVGLKAQYERVYDNKRAGANGVRVQLVFVF